MNQAQARRLAREIKQLAQRLYDHAPLDPSTRPKRSLAWGRGKDIDRKRAARGAATATFVIERDQREKVRTLMATGAWPSQKQLFNEAIAAFDPPTAQELQDVAVILASGGEAVTTREAIRYALAYTARLLSQTDAATAGQQHAGAVSWGADQHEGGVVSVDDREGSV